MYVAQTFFVELQLDERIQQLIWNVFFSSPFFKFLTLLSIPHSILKLEKTLREAAKKWPLREELLFLRLP